MKFGMRMFVRCGGGLQVLGFLRCLAHLVSLKYSSSHVKLSV